MQKIVPFLWFNDQAEEAMKFYTSIFKNSKIGSVTRMGDEVPGPKGKWCRHPFSGGPGIHGAERWTDTRIQIQRVDIVLC